MENKDNIDNSTSVAFDKDQTAHSRQEKREENEEVVRCVCYLERIRANVGRIPSPLVDIGDVLSIIVNYTVMFVIFRMRLFRSSCARFLLLLLALFFTEVDDPHFPDYRTLAPTRCEAFRTAI